MKTPFLGPASIRSLDPRYTVYISEIQKRLMYVGVSFLLAFFCAYTQKVSLMYSMTLSLQQALPGGVKVNAMRKGRDTTPSFFEKIEEIDGTFLSKYYQKVVYALQNMTRAKQSFASTLHAHDETMETLFLPGEEKRSALPSFSLFSEDTAISGDGVVRFIFTDVEEAFYTLLSVSLFWCAFVCFPVLLYHTLCFFQPSFYVWQSQRVWFSMLWRIIFVYGVLQFVHLFVIPALLSFFYSFQIERSSLCLHAETKVVSYVSMYVFVYCITVIFLVMTGIWSSYKQRQILRCLHATRLPALPPEKSLFTNLSFTNINDNLRQTDRLPKQQNLSRDKYRDHRGKVWWGCLLSASVVSPPEISSQLGCAFFLILLSEISIWLAYALACRFWSQLHPSHSFS